MIEEYCQILSKTLLFENIDVKDIGALLGCFNPRIGKYKKNDYIIIAGEKFEGIGILLKGEAEIIKETAAGNRLIISSLEPGEMFGEMAAFARNSAWPATVHSLGECVVVFLPPDKIIGNCERVCPWHKRLIQNMLKIISEKALILNRKVEYLTIKSIRGKISTFLIEQYKRTGKTTFVLPMNRNNLADFLNITRPSMSREMCHMRDEGLIDFHMSSVKILDLEGLKNFID